MRRRVIRVFAFLAVVYLGIVGVMCISENDLVYRSTREHTLTPAAMGLAFETVTLTTADQITLHAWLLPGEPARPTVLFLHGNGGNISSFLDTVKVYRQLGCTVFLPDYRGYGHSGGSPTEAGLYEDSETAWRYLTETRGIPAQRIVIVGHSLGGGVATWLAERHPSGGLILDATFTRLPDVGARIYPWLPVRWIARNRFPSVDRLPNIVGPVLILHSREDELIPFAHAEQLFAAAHEPKTLVPMRGSHGGGAIEDVDTYRNAVARWLP